MARILIAILAAATVMAAAIGVGANKLDVLSPEPLPHPSSSLTLDD